jgi:hypothetical protein
MDLVVLIVFLTRNSLIFFKKLNNTEKKLIMIELYHDIIEK